MPRPTGGAAGYVRTIPLVYSAVAADLSGTGAIDPVVGPVALGFTCEVEEFGFTTNVALTGGPQTFTLCDASGNVIASLAVAATLGKGLTSKTTTVIEAYREVRDATTLTIKRAASGTSISAGGGQFYVKVRQRPQSRIAG